MNEKSKIIYLAGGCFWGVEEYMLRNINVENIEVGYANGKTTETSYREIGKTNHSEVVKIEYNKNSTSLEEILKQYFKIIDPTAINRQGNDVGTQYRTGIYYEDEEDKIIIENFINSIREEYYKEIVVEIEKINNYVKAEEYHQRYLRKNPNGYCHIDFSKDKEEKYKVPTEEELREQLTEEQYKITQEEATERPFTNLYNDKYEKGIYVDIVTGEPLFASTAKYNAGCGWPSFTKPIKEGNIIYRKDNKLLQERTEVRSKIGDSHLGHVFNDGPIEDGGLRYCINSGSLKFVPLEEMEEKGYGNYIHFVK